MFCFGAALFGAMILLPLYYQQVRHEDVLVTGLLMGPGGLGAALAMPFAGRLTDRFGGGRIALVGMIVVVLASIPFGLIGAHTSILGLSFAMFAARHRHRLRLHPGDDRRVLGAARARSFRTRRRS